MKVSLNWLRELIELPATTDALVDLLTLAGVEVEDVLTTGCNLPNVVVAEIKSFVQHPNADRLSVVMVDHGAGGELRQIVCGAKNFKVGDRVPLALPGARLPGDFTIKAGKLRGVESNGMLCSGKELNLADDADGLLILPGDARIGAPIGDLYPGDTVLDLEITPNRPDLLSHTGIAREIGALTGKRLEWPKGPAVEIRQVDLPTVSVETATPVYYTARHLRGVKVAPSPEWLRSRLEAVGLRAINNVVDVTNYVMLSSGQPLHAFDAAKIQGHLRVRDARDGEQFLALDGKTYSLAAGDLVIADDEKAVAIAGIMGGEESGVSSQTTDLLLESAYFDPATIRRTSRRLGLSTDSSYRFERQVDVPAAMLAGLHAAQLIGELGGASLVTQAAPAWSDEKLQPGGAVFNPSVPLRLERVQALLGVAVSAERVDDILRGFELRKAEDGWKIPSFRKDLTREVDLIEEIARVVGMDAVPARTQGRFAPASPTDRNYDRANGLRRALVGHGLHEARSITLVPEKPLALGALKIAGTNLQRVKNPMNDEQVVLRPHLLHGLLNAVTTNLRAGAKSVRLFEIGRVFSTLRPEEFSHAAVVLSGETGAHTWRGNATRAIDLFDLKGLLEDVLGATCLPEANPAVALSLSIQVAGKPVGFAGQLWPADSRALDAIAPVVFAEIDLAALWKASPPDLAKKYREIPRFPAVTRDIALLAPLTLAHAEVERALRSANEPLLAGVELFDLFTDPAGARVPADKKSLAYSLTYRSPDRTLTADEVNAAHGKVKEKLKALEVSLRE